MSTARDETREKAVGILGAKKLRELEQSRLMVVDAIEWERRAVWIEYLEKQLKISKGANMSENDKRVTT